jgi:hypothetical protein
MRLTFFYLKCLVRDNLVKERTDNIDGGKT